MIERLRLLKEAVEAGEMPSILNCSSCNTGEFTCGDLQELGWMNKRYICGWDGEVEDIERDYFGPKPIKMRTCGAGERIVYPGETV